MAVSGYIPDFDKVITNTVNRTKVVAVKQVEAEAKINAPVDTGFYRNNIVGLINSFECIARAQYSKFIEYGTKYQRPNPVMRNAGRKVQKDIKGIFYSTLSQELKRNRKAL